MSLGLRRVNDESVGKDERKVERRSDAGC